MNGIWLYWSPGSGFWVSLNIMKMLHCLWALALASLDIGVCFLHINQTKSRHKLWGFLFIIYYYTYKKSHWKERRSLPVLLLKWDLQEKMCEVVVFSRKQNVSSVRFVWYPWDFATLKWLEMTPRIYIICRIWCKSIKFLLGKLQEISNANYCLGCLFSAVLTVWHYVSLLQLRFYLLWRTSTFCYALF